MNKDIKKKIKKIGFKFTPNYRHENPSKMLLVFNDKTFKTMKYDRNKLADFYYTRTRPKGLKKTYLLWEKK